MLETLKCIDIVIYKLINSKWAIPLLDPFFMAFRNPIYLKYFYFIIAMLLIGLKKRRGLVTAIWLALTMGISDIISSRLVKPFFQRTRPCRDIDLEGQVRSLIDCSQGFSFTSSHSVNNFAVCIFIFILLHKFKSNYKYVFLILPMLVAYSQVYVGVHYPFDVLMGAILGTLISIVSYISYNKFVPIKFKLGFY